MGPRAIMAMLGIALVLPAAGGMEASVLDTVWVANQVNFALETVGRHQFAAYYDANRMMTIAARLLDGGEWRKTTLPSQLVWDSHNGVALGIDDEGYVHVCGNMHATPLVYFRSRRPFDIAEMVACQMLGQDEASVTYPKFFKDGQGRLMFSYRSGTCGNGNILVNRFEPDQQRWVRHLQTALFEGTAEGDNRAAYHSFVRDSDGNFHFAWMWRWTPMVETCHQLCYAKSPDLLHWTNGAGEPVALPFRPDTPSVTVDDTPSKGGMHNSRFQVILTPDDRPILGYVKYDQDGLTQLYLARHDGLRWISNAISDWNFRWKFEGGGDQMTRGGAFRLAGFASDGALVVPWSNQTGATGEYRVDPATLELVNSTAPLDGQLPSSIRHRLSETPGLSVCLQADAAGRQPDGTEYLLKWEASGKSHGKHAPAIIPDGPLSPLLVLAIRYR